MNRLLTAALLLTGQGFCHRLSVTPFAPKVLPAFEEPCQQTLASFHTSARDPVQIATDFASYYLDSNDFISSFVVKNAYTSDNQVTHVYLKQLYKGREVINGDMNINVHEKGILSFGNSFSQKSDIEASENRPLITPIQALERFLEFVGVEERVDDIQFHHDGNYMYANEAFTLTNVKSIAKNDIDAKLSYIITENGLLKLVWNLKVDMKGSDNWFDTAVCAYSGNVLSLIDWVADALYNVYPIGTAHPLDGRRALLVDPYPKNASPLGWHQTKSWNSTQTKGNNVYAQENVDGGYDWANNYRPDGSRSLKFDFPIDFKKSPKSYLDAAITNLFFWNNIMHDLFYQYGFNEVSGNFQEDNFGRGGLGMDGVIANAQDGSGTNNANFATPPDGQRGRMRMYVWTQTNPNRDGDLENGIIIHEYGHGISTRLTGGPANSGCLGFGEAGGMGEGWSDVFAVLLRQRPSYNRTMRFSMGDYSNGGIGIRRYDYTTNMKINPETYGYIKKSGYWGVHAKGEVWAGILLESYWNFVDKYGFNENWYNKFGGNSMFLSLVVDGLKLQPCRPTFVDARNAILQADKVKFNGKNSCLLWKGFAKRGLGLKASAGGNEDFSMPTECS